MRVLAPASARFFDPKEAETEAAAMQAEDDGGWTYKAVKLPTGPYSHIEIYDEAGLLVGKI